MKEDLWQKNAPLGALSWFRCGGSADTLFYPANTKALAAFLAAPEGQKITILGAMANTLIRDGGVEGVTVRLGRGFSIITQEESDILYVGAGALNGTVAAAAARAGIGGFAFLSGIPGTIGGALRMNAGAYGSDMATIVIEVYALNLMGQPTTLTPWDMGFGYRTTSAPKDLIFTGALLRGTIQESPACIWKHMEAIKHKRLETQPIRERTSGSTFANPSDTECETAGLPPGTRAWQVIDRVGGRGLRVGGAMMSVQHCNFMVNTGTATATDLENLGQEIRRRVYESLGLSLRWEIECIGRGLAQKGA